MQSETIISSSICFFLILVNVKVVPEELLSPTDLLKAQTLSVYKLLEVVVIREDKNLIFVTLKVVAPSLKGFNDSQEFLIVSLILDFNEDYFSR